MTEEQKNEFIRKFTYEAGDGFRMDTSSAVPGRVIYWIDQQLAEKDKEMDDLKRDKLYWHLEAVNKDAKVNDLRKALRIWELADMRPNDLEGSLLTKEELADIEQLLK